MALTHLKPLQQRIEQRGERIVALAATHAATPLKVTACHATPWAPQANDTINKDRLYTQEIIPLGMKYTLL